MPQVAQMADRYAVDFHDINRILPAYLSPLGIMEGGYADDEYTAYLVLAGTIDHVVFAADSLYIGMRQVLMADRDDIGRLFPQRITQIGGERIGDNNGLTSFNAEARMA